MIVAPQDCAAEWRSVAGHTRAGRFVVVVRDGLLLLRYSWHTTHAAAERRLRAERAFARSEALAHILAPAHGSSPARSDA